MDKEKTNYKELFDYFDKVEDMANETVQITEGLHHNLKTVINTIEFYTNDRYLSGQKDENGLEKPFFNVCNFRITTAKVATDLDLKDIRYEADSLKFSIQTMIINKELYKYLKEINFSKTLNEIGFTRPKYGGVIVKKQVIDGQLNISVVDWNNIDVDPIDIANGAKVETHYMLPSDFSKQADVWENVDEVIKYHLKATKNKPAKIVVKEMFGEFPENIDPKYTPAQQGKDGTEYKMMSVYIAEVNKKKFFLYKEDMKESPYKYLAWETVSKRGLGRGVVEEGFEAQAWTNDSIIAMNQAMKLAGKVILSTTSNKVKGNVVTGVSNGHIFELEPNTAITPLNLLPSALPEYQNIINLWDQQYNKSSSVFDANTGEAPTAGTPYSQTALLNQVANSPFEYRREEYGIFLNEILNDWVLPFLKKRIVKSHDIVSDYTDEELEIIDEAVSTFEGNRLTIDKVLNGQVVSPEEYQAMKDSIRESLGKDGKKRQFAIPEKFLDVEGNITCNITGELKNKSAILQSLDSILKTIISTFNPNTGEYGATTDPTLSPIVGQIAELSGAPISSAMLTRKKSVTSSAQPDQSAIQPLPTN